MAIKSAAIEIAAVTKFGDREGYAGFGAHHFEKDFFELLLRGDEAAVSDGF